MNNDFIYDGFTTIACGIIIIAFLIAWRYIASKDGIHTMFVIHLSSYSEVLHQKVTCNPFQFPIHLG